MEINNNGSKRDFSTDNAYTFAMQTIKKNFLFIIGLGVIYSIVLYVIEWIFKKAELLTTFQTIPASSLAIYLAAFVIAFGGILIIYTIILPILNKLSLQFYDNNWGCFRHRLISAFADPKKLLKAFAVTFIFLFIQTIILIAIEISSRQLQKIFTPSFVTITFYPLLVTAIALWVYFLITYLFSILLAVDTDCTIRQAFKRSAQLTHGLKLKLLGLLASMIITTIVYFAIAGALIMLIGILLGYLNITASNVLKEIIGNIINLSGLMLITLACVSAYRQLVPSTTPAHKLCECDINFKNLFKKK